MPEVSFIKILFLYPILFYQNCMDAQSGDCYNNDWSNRVADCAGTLFKGRFSCSEQISLQFNNNILGLKFRFNFTGVKLDSWDAGYDYLQVLVNDVVIDTVSYAANLGTNMCFNSGYQDMFYSKSYNFNLPQGKTSLKLTLQGHFDEDVDNEAWGAKRFTLEIFQPCVEFYSDCNFQGEVWRICNGNQTSQVRNIPFEIKSILIVNGIQVKMRDPKYHGGQTQTYTSSQYCLSSYQFPKYNQNV
ncbi:unnamed protein product (macronuclear) [Paramecium tetraurelia]|uniref:Uncharacterized protein n=1 Tax=Paramecium tetraurelia TaxID=5888 RepID=A0E0M0_PARTE|nr:uncharacterized protein GSPATT00022005001 [Paramecium tetraurelia]CAK88837.1 unnamed protein product [Paramecium tetraurelia]|eukprot:XP_001456234.1 hypothetical protein (macronuclear) [Paramecium tetraurelia strain d4-2]